MPEDLVQLVHDGYAAWNRGDRSWVLDHMSPEVEWITPSEDLDRGTYRGYEGVEEFWAQWRAAVGQLSFVPEKTIAAGEHVVVFARRAGRGEHSGLNVSDQVIQVFSFEGGTCVRVREFYDREEALREIGITELAEQ